MITLIICIVLVIWGIVLARGWEYDELGIWLTIFSGCYLVGHLCCWGLTSYNYESNLIRRDSFELTLKNSRESGYEYETAAIVLEIASWNKGLATQKYDNKTLFWDQYIDDRYEDLEPIK